MKYFKRYWDETSGDDFTDSWGRSYFYFETDDQLNVLRQLQVFENGQILKYHTDYIEDLLGGLSEVELDEEFQNSHIEKAEFELIWIESRNCEFPEVVITEEILWGQPRLDGRRLAVGDIVSQVDIASSITDAVKDYDITMLQISQVLAYCRALQCVRDKPTNFCHNCTLRVQQEGDSDGEEQDNWKRADKLFNQYFT